ncbi:aldo-keto reductase family 1 member B1-like [Teleopsis dalmanni]|uniref:aldo-keto reductase family 1 member B1-like n=1 Tax=Teleopsis dalmanni TaxID=139649 RepID=UPI0018CD0E96|nr:aldo-keto reductase family 1 member B1-like [Teleopsis dalmanni]XP_037939297.1 aldo-keto reductase family 1 member B1-like [Teleopsis dalmanni]
MASPTENGNKEIEEISVMKMQLNNGQSMPVIGLGTWRSLPASVYQAVKDAIDLGYRHIDCAHSYGNETEIGLAIKDKIDEGVLKREDLFVTSKLWCTYHRPDMVRVGCEQSLRRLKLNYLDCYLIHWPTAFEESKDLYPMDEKQKVIFADYNFVSTWSAMEELVDQGLCRTIGVSNFNKRQIEEILKTALIPPAVLQVECHPYLNQKRLIGFAKENDMVVVCYSPLGSSHTPYEKPGKYKLLENPTIVEMAKKYKCNPAQILLRYQIDRGNVVIPRSITKSHMKDNLDVGDFKLTKEDLLEIDQLDINGRIMDFKVAAGHPHHPFENDEF